MGGARLGWWVLAALVLSGLALRQACPACCYFAAKDAVIRQPALQVFITWDPVKKMQSLTIQPSYAGNAQEFGMVIPAPTLPRWIFRAT
jgi:hypothetical protein